MRNKDGGRGHVGGRVGGRVRGRVGGRVVRHGVLIIDPENGTVIPFFQNRVCGS